MGYDTALGSFRGFTPVNTDFAVFFYIFFLYFQPAPQAIAIRGMIQYNLGFFP